MNDLHNQLIKLGDMMGDGLHLEPGGKWISQDYKRIAKALGYSISKKRQRRANPEQVNALMAERVKETKCGKCSGVLKQTRLGSMRASCESCGAKFQLLKAKY
ncbi:hypothetical protein NGK36_17260 [Hafnia alvei]|uniref:hypothetical protein n=1 Tax=Hafnia alvei TaxID=569 RepID=UPI002DBB626F|nr:hypothetical protein [Hafnia alvei]MEB7891021.1 hypothetical protein [Hafnia alvei]